MVSTKFKVEVTTESGIKRYYFDLEKKCYDFIKTFSVSEIEGIKILDIFKYNSDIRKYERIDSYTHTK